MTFSTFTHRCDLNLHGYDTWQPGKPCFSWWMLEEAKLILDQGQGGHVLNDGTEVLMRYLAKSTMVAAVIPSAGRFISGGRGI